AAPPFRSVPAQPVMAWAQGEDYHDTFASDFMPHATEDWRWNASAQPTGNKNGGGQHEPAFGPSRVTGPSGSRDFAATSYRQRRGHDRNRLADTGLRPLGGRRFPQAGSGLRESQRQQDRLQHPAFPGAEPEGGSGADQWQR